MSTGTKVKLWSSDKEMFEVDRVIACESLTVKNMIDDTGVNDPIPLSNISSSTLAKVIEYCTYHVELRKSTETEPTVAEDKMESQKSTGKKPAISEDEMASHKSTETKPTVAEDEMELQKSTGKKPAISEDEMASQKSTEMNSAIPDDEMKRWDAEFIKIDQFTLFDLILAANYLNVQDLVELACRGVAELMKGKTTEQLRRTFNIKNDFTPAEEEKIKRENRWAFE